MDKIFVLMQTGFGTIMYSRDFEEVKKEYDLETSNGRYAGFSIFEIEENFENLKKMSSVNLYGFLKNACYLGNGKQVL